MSTAQSCREHQVRWAGWGADLPGPGHLRDRPPSYPSPHAASGLLGAAGGYTPSQHGCSLPNTALSLPVEGGWGRQGTPPMSPPTRSISQSLDGSLEESQTQPCSPHCLGAISSLPPRNCCCEVPAPSSCPFLPNHPPRACPHGGCCPHPQLQPPGGSSFGLQRLRTPAPPPSHLALGVPGQDPPMSQLCCSQWWSKWEQEPTWTNLEECPQGSHCL